MSTTHIPGTAGAGGVAHWEDACLRMCPEALGLIQMGEALERGCKGKERGVFSLKYSGVEEWRPHANEAGVSGSERASHKLGTFS